MTQYRKINTDSSGFNMAHKGTLSRTRQRRRITVVPNQRNEAEPSTPSGAQTPGETQWSRAHPRSAAVRANEPARCVQGKESAACAQRPNGAIQDEDRAGGSASCVQSQDALLRPAQAARLLNVTPRCLQDWRLKGAGPRFIRMSPKLVHYRRSDLENFIRKSARHNPSRAKSPTTQTQAPRRLNTSGAEGEARHHTRRSAHTSEAEGAASKGVCDVRTAPEGRDSRLRAELRNLFYDAASADSLAMGSTGDPYGCAQPSEAGQSKMMREWLMASDIARLGRAGVAGLPGSKSQAQIFLQRFLSLSVARAEARGSGFTSFENDRKRASVQSMRRLARGRCGGGFEYHASILPEPARVAIYQYELQFAAGPAGDVPPAASSPLETAAAPGRDLNGAKRNSFVTSFENDGKRRRALIEMPLWARRTADARAALLDALAHFAAAANAATATSPLILARFAESWNAGHITTDSDAHSLIQRVAAPTILRWHRLRARGGLAALAPRYGNRRGSGILDTNPAVRELLLAMIARYGKHLRAPRIAEAIAAKFPALRISKSAIRVFLRRWHRENASLSEAINNPDRWKGKYRIKIAKADEAIVRLNQEWQIDGTPGDVMLISDNIQGRSPHLDIAGGVEPLRGSTSAHLKLSRFHILALIDVFSRRVMFHVAPSEGAAPAVRLISRAMIAWGVPEIIHGDNGKGFISNYAQRSLADLGIRYLASPPFQPETKPFVESVIGTMAHELLAMLPGFIGHSVAQRQEIRARSSFAARFGAPPEKIFQVNLTAAELQAKLDAWAEHLYGDRS